MIDIPKGFATKLGTFGTALLAVVAALQPFLEGDHTGDARFFATLSTLLAAVTIAGRMLQAASALRDAPSPAQTGDYADPGEWTDTDEPNVPKTVPSDMDLSTQYEGEAPTIGGKAGEQS